MNQWSVFTGVFADELGQRFLRIVSHACDLTFSELHTHSMPSHPKRYQGCLDRVSTWDTVLVAEESSHIEQMFPDVHDVFKHIFVSYVRAMRGQAKSLRIKIQIPKFITFLQLYFTNLAGHRYMRDGKYFEVGPLEQRVILMDSTRDSLFQFLGDDYVRLEDKSVVDVHPALTHAFAKPVEEAEGSYVDDIQPDDSVSNVDFAEKQNRELRQIASMKPVDEQSDNSGTSLSSMTISQLTRNPPPDNRALYRADAQSETSLSRHRREEAPSEVSTVPSDRQRHRREEMPSEVSTIPSERQRHRREETLSEVSTVPSERQRHRREETPSEVSTSEVRQLRDNDTLSEISMRSDSIVDRKPYRKPSAKSYVTSLTADDTDTYG